MSARRVWHETRSIIEAVSREPGDLAEFVFPQTAFAARGCSSSVDGCDCGVGPENKEG